MTVLSWKTVLHCEDLSFESLALLAKELNYKFFIHNNLVYKTGYHLSPDGLAIISAFKIKDVS